MILIHSFSIMLTAWEIHNRLKKLIVAFHGIARYGICFALARFKIKRHSVNKRRIMQEQSINSFISSLTEAIDIMRVSDAESQRKQDIINLERIRLFFTGLKYGEREIYEKFFEEIYWVWKRSHFYRGRNSSGIFRTRATSRMRSFTSNPMTHDTEHDLQALQGRSSNPSSAIVSFAFAGFLYPYAYM